MQHHVAWFLLHSYNTHTTTLRSKCPSATARVLRPSNGMPYLRLLHITLERICTQIDSPSSVSAKCSWHLSNWHSVHQCIALLNRNTYFFCCAYDFFFIFQFIPLSQPVSFLSLSILLVKSYFRIPCTSMLKNLLLADVAGIVSSLVFLIPVLC